MNTPLTPDLHLGLVQEGPAPNGVAALRIQVEWTRYCQACDGERTFIATTCCDKGLIARCTNCGDLRIAPYTRTNSEAWEAYT